MGMEKNPPTNETPAARQTPSSSRPQMVTVALSCRGDRQSRTSVSLLDELQAQDLQPDLIFWTSLGDAYSFPIIFWAKGFFAPVLLTVFGCSSTVGFPPKARRLGDLYFVWDNLCLDPVKVFVENRGDYDGFLRFVIQLEVLLGSGSMLYGHFFRTEKNHTFWVDFGDQNRFDSTPFFGWIPLGSRGHKTSPIFWGITHYQYISYGNILARWWQREIFFESFTPKISDWCHIIHPCIATWCIIFSLSIWWGWEIYNDTN